MKRLAVAALLLAAACRREASAPAPPEPARGVRPAAEAGRFYPADAAQLEATVRALVDAAPRRVTAPARVVLAPHAGLVYSGAVAAAALKQLTPGFARAVVVAANHSATAFEGASVDLSPAWRMPGFEVPVATAAVRALRERRGFLDVPAAHAQHMVEIELPFLRAVNGGRPFDLVPVVAGALTRQGARQLAAELLRLDAPGTVYVFSVDLSHYHAYDRAVALDRGCLAALERMDSEAIAHCDTDGTQVLLAMAELAAMQKLTPRLVDYRNSGDTGGDRSRVVGYGAMAFEERFELGADEQRELLALARRAIETHVREGGALEVPDELVLRYPRLGVPRGAFVTLRSNGGLRGCIGSLVAVEPLARDVARNAVNAAVRDPRFAPLTAAEMDAVDLSISVLEPRQPLPAMDPEALVRLLSERRPGVVLEYRGRRSTFLPEVWEDLPDAAQFLAQLSLKQGSPSSAWRDPAAKFETYGSQHFGEKGR